MALIISNFRYSSVKLAYDTLQNTQIRDQLEEGKACGIVTNKEAKILLTAVELNETGSVVPSSSITASSRGGSPRVDGCSYSSPNSNITYLDIVIRTYASNKDAEKYFLEDTAKVLGITNKDIKDDTGRLLQRRYSSGVWYTLIDNIVVETSASKMGATTGEPLEIFSRQVHEYITQKL